MLRRVWARTDRTVSRSGKGALSGLERQSIAAFEKNLGSDAIAFTPYGTLDRKTQLEQQQGASKACQVRSFDFNNVHVQRVTKDTAILTYLVKQDAVCGGQAVPSPLFNTSVYAKRNGRWQIVYRSSQAHP